MLLYVLPLQMKLVVQLVLMGMMQHQLSPRPTPPAQVPVGCVQLKAAAPAGSQARQAAPSAVAALQQAAGLAHAALQQPAAAGARPGGLVGLQESGQQMGSSMQAKGMLMVLGLGGSLASASDTWTSCCVHLCCCHR